VTKPGWGTIASLATAGGPLVLAVSTFASVRSANRAAGAAEQSLLVGLRPLLMPSRLQDPEQKILFCAAGIIRAGSGWRAGSRWRDNGQWIAPASRHHNVDRPDPR
jgi:hypothetical protein